MVCMITEIIEPQGKTKKKGIQLFSLEAFLELFKEGVEELDLEKALAKALQHCFKASWLSL